jgi:hypothetical protein
MTPSPEAAITWAQALSWRLGRQFLQPVGSGSVADVVRRLGAVLSMDESLAEVALGMRRSSSAPGELAAALAAGEVIRTFSFRGSMHYMAPEEAGTYLSLRMAGRQWELKSWVDYYQLTPSDWPDFRAAVREALSDGPLTVVELGEALARHRAYQHLKPVFDDGAGTLVKPLCWHGDVSLASPREGKLTLQRLDTNPRWAGVPDLDEAGPRAITAYFGTYGPATLDNLQHWLGSGLSAGRKRLDGWFASLGDALVPLDVEGEVAYAVRSDVDAVVAATSSEAVRFLPGHDQWVMGPGTKDVHVTPPSRRDLVTRKANPVIVGGVVRGTWARKGDELSVTWLDDRPRPDDAIRQQADRLGVVVGRELRLALT